MPYLRTIAEFVTRLEGLRDSFPAICTKANAGPRTAEGRDMPYVTITGTSGPSVKTNVLIIAGLHAREWAPPDSVLSFITTLLTQGTSGPPSYTPRVIHYPSFTRPDIGVRFPRLIVNRAIVAAILRNLKLIVLPVGNPDGRDFSFTAPAEDNMFQRKNRRDFGATTPCYLVPPPDRHPILLDLSKGVDINRNFSMGFDIATYYDPAYLPQLRVSTSACGGPPTNRSGDSFQGPNKFSEQETKNIKALMDDNNVQYMIDVHSYSRLLMFSWEGIGTSFVDPSSNYQNPTKDGTRNASYGEFLPEATFRKASAIAGRMQATILQMKTDDASSLTDPRHNPLNSEYQVSPDILRPLPGRPGVFPVPLYPAPGTSTDDLTLKELSTVVAPTYAESLVPPERFAFAMEAGIAEENQFWPNSVNEFPKIEREIHMAIWGLLGKAAAPSSGIPVRPVP